MRRYLIVTVIAACAILAGSLAMADTLSVNASAAMNGSNYGLEVFHDNSSVAYVEDDTPDGESVYRFSFIYNPRTLGSSGNGAPWAMTIFGAMGANPRPNSASACPQNAAIPVFPVRIFARYGGPGLTIPGVRMTVMTNFCGVLGSPPIYWTENVPKKICGFVETGTPLHAGIAVVDPGDSCPSADDPAYSLVPATANNNEHAVDFCRLGNLAINPYNAGESGSFYVDEFESYRTLAP